MNNSIPDCIFCKIASGHIQTELLYQDEQLIAFADLYPQAPTHVLIIPRLHIATLNDLNSEQGPLIGHMLLTAKYIAHKTNIAQRGYRTIFNCNAEAGQSVFHIHLHLLGGRILGWPPG